MFVFQTIGFFFKDLVKKLLVSTAISLPITAAIIWIIKWGGDYFFLYAWVFTLVVSLVSLLMYYAFSIFEVQLFAFFKLSRVSRRILPFYNFSPIANRSIQWCKVHFNFSDIDQPQGATIRIWIIGYFYPYTNTIESKKVWKEKKKQFARCKECLTTYSLVISP